MYRIILSLLTFSLLIGCTEQSSSDSFHGTSLNQRDTALQLKDITSLTDFISAHTVLPTINLADYDQAPNEWGENISHVKTRFQTNEKEIALTFDACGGPFGNEMDHDLIDFLILEEIPATLFINEQWINDNTAIFLELAANPLFQIENHGTDHLPLSVSGKEAWGIGGTNSPEEVYREITGNHETVQQLTGKQMSLFRSGTAFYDDVAVNIAIDLGYELVNYDILGDAGATFSSKQVTKALLQAKPGSIALLHMNQPRSGTADGVKNAVPLLQAEGFTICFSDGKVLRGIIPKIISVFHR